MWYYFSRKMEQHFGEKQLVKIPEADGRYKMTLRLPQALAEKLKSKAQEERRSITTTLEIILEEYFAIQEKSKKDIPSS